MWVRGLKHTPNWLRDTSYRVAPYVGAWIETDILKLSLKRSKVAPYVGAWIETPKRVQ